MLKEKRCDYYKKQVTRDSCLICSISREGFDNCQFIFPTKNRRIATSYEEESPTLDILDSYASASSNSPDCGSAEPDSSSSSDCSSCDCGD